MEALIVRLQTDDGLVGWGEAFGHLVNPGTQAILDTLVGPWLLGRDPRPIAATMEEAQRTFHGFGRTGPVLYALSAIDIALWDLAGKRAGMPVFRMLGGDARPLPLYASLMRYGGDAEALRATSAAPKPPASPGSNCMRRPSPPSASPARPSPPRPASCST